MKFSISHRPWPLILLLLLAVMVPTICVLWFMVQATENERLAVREKLLNSYRLRIEGTPAKVEKYWQTKLESLHSVADTAAARQSFWSMVTDNTCDAVIFYGTQGEVLYPETAVNVTPPALPSQEWIDATDTENVAGDFIAAAAAYGAIAAHAADSMLRAEALQAQARCLGKAGDVSSAIDIFNGLLATEEYLYVQDQSGRSIGLDSQLRAIELMSGNNGAFAGALDHFLGLLSNYAIPSPSSQRRFLMRRFCAIKPDLCPTSLLAAEDLAASYIDTSLAPGSPGVFQPVSLPDVWQLVSSGQRVVGLFRTQNIQDSMAKALEVPFNEAGAELKITPSTTPVGNKTFRLVEPVLMSMPGWEWRIAFTDEDPFAAAAGRRIVLYFWTAGLTVVAASFLALLLAMFMSRQVRLTQLKSELIDVVSHELKSPVAGTRILVNTLLEGRCQNREQELDYLRLIERENSRLSHLIDNFLTFSRMERRRYAFEFKPVTPSTIVDAAAKVVRDKFAAPDCQLRINVHNGLPEINGDCDALTTALLNLLDNAYKYSGPRKSIAIRAYAKDDRVNLEVEDNGYGLPRRAARRVFEKFYQVDTSLSRKTGGCGLGLAIVKFVVNAHGGSVSVSSKPGEGSTFRISLPAARQRIVEVPHP